jgi:predicted RNase H-like HicB family nuclease
MSGAEAYPCVTSSVSPEEGGGYVVSFPDIPGCLGMGDTPQEAREDARQALLACLEALKAVDREPPVPSAPAA